MDAEFLIMFVLIVLLWRISGGYSQDMMGLVLEGLFLECDSFQLIWCWRSHIVKRWTIVSRFHDVSWNTFCHEDIVYESDFIEIIGCYN